MRDFFEIVKLAGYYSEEAHNKTEKTFTFPSGSMVEFFAIDEDQKVRGRKRDILYINEANELDRAIYIQLMLRTRGKCLMDFNPSDSESYIYELLEKDNSQLIKTTYLDNPFLEEEQVKFIEQLIDTDENYYKIYALGERPVAITRVYNHFKIYKTKPEHINSVAYGLDFGYNHPCGLVKCYFGDEIYVEEMLYKSALTSQDLVKEIDKLNINKNDYIYCDFARPEIIEDLKRAGYNVKNANKEVIAGINSVKTSRININEESVNLLNEYKKYSWKVNGDRVLDEVVKLYDDLLDALRYCIHSHNTKIVIGKPKFY
jgi:phage terminase large subunit